LLNRLAGGINCIGRLATNPFGGAIRHSDSASTGPMSGQSTEWPLRTWVRMALRRNKQNCGREQCRFEAVRKKFLSVP
jgi:hypothetical protein